MAAHPETLKIVQTVHDTVRDTVIRVVEPSALDRGVHLGAGLATIATVGIAIWGIRAWRHQLRGAAEYRLAIRVYRALLRLRDHIVAAREPWNHQVPILEHEIDTNTLEFVERERKEYWNWFLDIIKSTLALKALRAEAEIYWDIEGTRHIDAMEECAKKLRGNYKAYFQARMRILRGEAGWAQVVQSYQKVIFNAKLMDTDNDEYGDDLNRVVEEARAFLKYKIDLTRLLPQRARQANQTRAGR